MLFSKDYTRVSAKVIPLVTDESLRITREGDPWVDPDWLSSGLKKLMTYRGEHYSYTGKKEKSREGRDVFRYDAGQNTIWVDKTHRVYHEKGDSRG